MDGFAVLRALKHHGDDTPVIVYTGTGNFDRCIEAVRLGASGFIDKAEPMERVAQEVEHAIERHRLRREVFALQTRLGESTLIGRSKAMADLRNTIARVAAVPSTVLIVGESGTGKELVARELHRLGANPTGPFVAINCRGAPRAPRGERAVRARARRVHGRNGYAKGRLRVGGEAARSSWTRSASCRWPRSPSCSACWSSTRSRVWAATRTFASTRAWWRPRTATSTSS